MKLHLAPMEGVVDWVLRDRLTRIGGIDQCVTEFMRVTHYLHSAEIFFKYCPELNTLSRTSAGTPVLVQLLGGQPEPLLQNAFRAYELGAMGVDFNFGCPAKLVNRHDGGAALLRDPQRIYEILKLARTALPSHFPVSAKMRLGYSEPSECLEIAKAIEESGVKTLTIHCRTKTEMYRPPAHWEWIARIKERTKLNIIANGDIFSVEDFNRCHDITKCDEFMIGRGALLNPFLFLEIKGNIKGKISHWPALTTEIQQFYTQAEQFRNPEYAVARTKQWLSQLAKSHNEAQTAFERVKRHNTKTFYNELAAALHE